eukprot:1557128-Rhodomonas_salina.1
MARSVEVPSGVPVEYKYVILRAGAGAGAGGGGGGGGGAAAYTSATRSPVLVEPLELSAYALHALYWRSVWGTKATFLREA